MGPCWALQRVAIGLGRHLKAPEVRGEKSHRARPPRPAPRRVRPQCEPARARQPQPGQLGHHAPGVAHGGAHLRKRVARQRRIGQKALAIHAEAAKATQPRTHPMMWSNHSGNTEKNRRQQALKCGVAGLNEQLAGRRKKSAKAFAKAPRLRATPKMPEHRSLFKWRTTFFLPRNPSLKATPTRWQTRSLTRSSTQSSNRTPPEPRGRRNADQHRPRGAGR